MQLNVPMYGNLSLYNVDNGYDFLQIDMR